MLNQELCDMSSRCRLEVVAGTNHISILKNDAVDKAVKEVVRRSEAAVIKYTVAGCPLPPGEGLG